MTRGRELVASQLDPATLTPTIAQDGSAYPTIRGPDAVIKLDQIGWEFGGYRVTVSHVSPLLLIDLGPSGITCVFELLPFRDEVCSSGRDGPQLGVKGFPLLHHVQYVVLERGLTSGQCRDLVLQALEFLGRQTSPGEPSLVARRARSDAVDFGFEPTLIRIDIGEPSLQLSCFRGEHVRALCGIGECGQFRKCAAAMGQLGKRRVGRL
jgi:hypothetical protein